MKFEATRVNSLYLFVFGWILLLSVPLNTYGQRRNTGNWKIGFYSDDNGGIDEPYYQMFIYGNRFEDNKKVKLLLRVDVAVINGFSLVVTDENNNFLHLGDKTIIRVTEDWENDETLKVNFANFELGSVLMIKEQTSLSRFADLLCSGKFAIIIHSLGAFPEDKLYVFEINNETLHLGEAVDNLLDFHKSINEVLKINEMYIGN